LIKRIWSITLYVTSIARSKDFYEKTLGLNKMYEYPTYIGFDCGGVELGLIPRNSVRVGEDAPSLQLLVDDVDEAYQTLMGKGVAFIAGPHDEPWGGRQARFQDLDGNVLELTQINWKRYFDVSSKGA